MAWLFCHIHQRAIAEGKIHTVPSMPVATYISKALSLAHPINESVSRPCKGLKFLYDKCIVAIDH